MKKLITILLLGFVLSGCGLTDYLDEYSEADLERMAYESVLKQCITELKECRGEEPPEEDDDTSYLRYNEEYDIYVYDPHPSE